MNSINLILKNIKNLLPYFILIGIYFFFISLEVNKEKNINNVIEKEYKLPKSKVIIEENKFRINIPVVPYKDYSSN
tara:strand:- start:1947 stop:2174 length:228 start_codon:yes stop_codon:yes gene_type:complete